jgi:threonine aldolase
MAYNGIISLVSDTETRPTDAMRRAIASAEVGDEQKGQDPTVNRLQERVAELLGKEAALWFPGGTMCNFVAVRVHTRPADAIVADWMSHIIRAESAGAVVSSGVLIEPIMTERGIFTPDELNAALGRIGTTPSPYSPPPRLVCVEQTHNFGGGAVWSLPELKTVAARVRELGLAMHMDGARLLNAAVATGVPAADFAGTVESVWIDFTKGLGAPIGAVLAGSKDFVAEARRQKHIFAGAMRQAGIAAAGCLHALDYHVERLAEDHVNARRLAAGLCEIKGINVRTPRPETNMVFFDPAGLGLSNGHFIGLMAERGVRLGEVRREIRAVLHLDVSATDIETALAAVRAIAQSEVTPPFAATSRSSGY